MKVKITKCSVPTYWYKNQIDSVVNVIDTGNDYTLDNEEGWIIDKQDCKIIEERNGNN